MSEARRRAETTFGYPLPNIIVTLREQGCTWRTVALALEVSRPQIYLWRRQFGIEIGGRIYDDLSQKETKVDQNARKLGYLDAEQAIIDLRMGGYTVTETASMLGVHFRTVTRRQPRWFSGTVFIKTKCYVESRQRTGLMAVARRGKRRKSNPGASWRSL